MPKEKQYRGDITLVLENGSTHYIISKTGGTRISKEGMEKKLLAWMQDLTVRLEIHELDDGMYFGRTSQKKYKMKLEEITDG